MINHLKSKIYKILERKILAHKDCELLAEDIELKTGSRIGITTLRRFFGLDKSTAAASAYTLDILSNYCGYKSWQHFASYAEQEQLKREIDGLSDMSLWEQVKAKSLALSAHTLTMIENNSALDYSAMIERSKLTQNIISFLESDFTALPLVAPPGYGKSVGLAKSIEKLWLDENCTYPEDIVFFIDAGKTSLLRSGELTISDWLSTQISMPEDNPESIFGLSRDSVRGRLILIIDSLHELSSIQSAKRTFYKTIDDLLKAKSKYPWFKLIVSMRNINWHSFNASLMKSDKQQYWYDYGDSAYDEDDFVNMPLFDLDEILSAINNMNITDSQKRDIHRTILLKDFESLLRYPRFLQYFIMIIQELDCIPDNEAVILRQCLYTGRDSGPYAEEKHLIIHKLLDKLDFTPSGMIKKKDITEEIISRESQKALDELVYFGLLSEIQHQNKYGTVTNYLRFNCKFAENYLRAERIIIDSHGFNDNLTKHYTQIQLPGEQKIALLKYIILLAFRHQAYTYLNSLHNLLGTENSIMTISHNEAETVIITIARSLRDNPEAHHVLIPMMAESKKWQTYFFERLTDYDDLAGLFGNALWFYKQNMSTADSLIFVHTLLLLKYIFADDSVEAQKHFQILEQLEEETEIENADVLILSRSLAVRMAYCSVFCTDSDSILAKVWQYEGLLYARNYDKPFITAFYSYILLGSAASGNSETVIKLWEKIKTDFDELKTGRQIEELKLVKATAAVAYYKNGNIGAAENLFEESRQMTSDLCKLNFELFTKLALSFIEDSDTSAELRQQALKTAQILGNKLMEKIISSLTVK